ncbi:substrate-binding periplasmic protein [Motilimonas eburnea]|uniref:substrate-binding periplasmic protein n=1 Tax=Motilimonas eburnea TaxID=1737488 RepID=UPI001E2C0C5D|nr:transporter substrate-binding domain-containing protein [Motilimonas eburnea]MCE2572700.1 transporter substrate-binding domain-containing protein [Motilimonas eburnea]
MALALTLIGVAQANSAPPSIQFYSEHFPPFTIDDHGDIHGEAVDLVRKMMLLLNHPDTIKVKPWARAYKRALRDPNSAIFLIARTPERENNFKWVGPLMQDRISLCQHKNDQNQYDDINQLALDSKIALPRGYPEQAVLTEMGFNQLRLTNNPTSAINMLLKQRVSLISCSPKALWDLLMQNATPTDEIQVTGIDLYHVDLYIAFHHQTSDATIKQWQQALEQVKASSEYIELND